MILRSVSAVSVLLLAAVLFWGVLYLYSISVPGDDMNIVDVKTQLGPGYPGIYMVAEE